MAASKTARKLNPSTITTLSLVEVPTWFSEAAEELSPARRRWLKALPPIALRSGFGDGESAGSITELPDLSRPWLISALVSSEKEGARHDLVDLVKRHARRESLDAWTKALLATWKDGREPSVDNTKGDSKVTETAWLDRDWVLTAAGTFGGDETAIYLQAAVREWTKTRKSTLAVRGVDMLGRIGSKAALEQVSTLSAVSGSRVVADAALRVAETKATIRGQTREQMEDTHTPACGLDDKGERIFRFGQPAVDGAPPPRTFRTSIGPDLLLRLTDSEGRLLKSMPKAGKLDDQEIAAAARAAWTDVKTGFKRVICLQIKRFEQAMITGRTWTTDGFQTHIVQHPIVRRFAQTLIWQVLDPSDSDSTLDGSLKAGHSVAFARLTEDLTLADAQENLVKLLPGNCLRVAHPLYFGAQDLLAWGELLSDYRIIQPFPQVARPVYKVPAPDKGHGSSFSLVPPAHTALKPGVLYGVLDNDGWRLGEFGKDNVISWSWKSFVGENVTALVFYSGFQDGISRSRDQTVDRIEFFAGIMDAASKPVRPDSKPLALHQVPPVAYSEVMRRLIRLTEAVDLEHD
ncbi:MAG: DUF4132 domain-containing protein [Candidatus Methylacidiphilales bacterium]